MQIQWNTAYWKGTFMKQVTLYLAPGMSEVFLRIKSSSWLETRLTLWRNIQKMDEKLEVVWQAFLKNYGNVEKVLRKINKKVRRPAMLLRMASKNKGLCFFTHENDALLPRLCPEIDKQSEIQSNHPRSMLIRHTSSTEISWKTWRNRLKSWESGSRVERHNAPQYLGTNKQEAELWPNGCT